MTDTRHNGVMSGDIGLARQQTYFEFMERIRLEYEVEKQEYATFDLNTIVPTHVPLLIDDNVPIQVALAPVVHNVSPMDGDSEFDASEAYQDPTATNQPSEDSVIG